MSAEHPNPFWPALEVTCHSGTPNMRGIKILQLKLKITLTILAHTSESTKYKQFSES